MTAELKNLQDAANKAGTSFWRSYRGAIIGGGAVLLAGVILGYVLG